MYIHVHVCTYIHTLRVCVCVFVYSHVCCKCMYVVDTSFSHQLLTSMALLMASAGITPDSLTT